MRDSVQRAFKGIVTTGIGDPIESVAAVWME
jgi:hypothetical protein